MSKPVFNMSGLESYANNLGDKVRVAIKESLVKIEQTALSLKRYTTRTGALDRAYVKEMPSDFFGGIYLDKTNIPYPYAIHSGRSDWPNYTPDLWMPRTYKFLKSEIEENLKQAVRP